MQLPVPTFLEGDGDVFNRRTDAFVAALPDIFDRVSELDLDRSYRGLQKLRFVEHLERGAGTASAYDAQKDVLSVFPLAFEIGSRIDLIVYAGLGSRHWSAGIPAASKVVWARALVGADEQVIDRIDAALAEGEIEQYDELVELFHSATERLQAAHIANALTKNSMSIQQMGSIGIRDYPPTKDFCSGDRKYSLIPLLSAYANADVRKYQNAFAQYCSRSGHLPISETSTEAAFVKLFKSVTLD